MSLSSEIHPEYYDTKVKCDYCHKPIGRFEVNLDGDTYDCVVDSVDGLHEECYQELSKK